MEGISSQKSVRGAVTPTRLTAARTSNGRPHVTPGSELTPREEDVLDMVRQALTNREIAGRLGLSEKTVKGHMTAVMRSSGSTNGSRSRSCREVVTTSSPTATEGPHNVAGPNLALPAPIPVMRPWSHTLHDFGGFVTPRNTGEDNWQDASDSRWRLSQQSGAA